IPVTTLTRYLSSPTVRSMLGLGSKTELVYTHDTEEVDQALKRFVLDSIPTSPELRPRVHSRADANDRKRYASELNSEGVTPSSLLPEPSAPSKASDTSSKTERSTPRRRSSVHPD